MKLCYNLSHSVSHFIRYQFIIVLHQKLFKTPILSLKIHVIRQMVILCFMSMSIYNLTCKPDNNDNKRTFLFCQLNLFSFFAFFFQWVTNKITIQCLRNQIKRKFIIPCFFTLYNLHSIMAKHIQISYII